jgi:hypothetical protein
MKKASKSAVKKPAQKKPTGKKSLTKPKRKAQGQSELAQVVARLDTIADKLAQTAERLAQLPAARAQPLPPASPAVEVQHPHVDEHADDVEVTSAVREE